jgi:hypothetical protein
MKFKKPNRFYSIIFKSISSAVAFSCLIANPAVARTQTGKITDFFVRNSDGLIYFFLDSASDNRPACAGSSYFMIKDENSAAGKRQLAVLLMARSTGQTITVYGTGTCTRWPDGEDVDTIQIRG